MNILLSLISDPISPCSCKEDCFMGGKFVFLYILHAAPYNFPFKLEWPHWKVHIMSSPTNWPLRQELMWLRIFLIKKLLLLKTFVRLIEDSSILSLHEILSLCKDTFILYSNLLAIKLQCKKRLEKDVYNSKCHSDTCPLPYFKEQLFPNKNNNVYPWLLSQLFPSLLLTSQLAHIHWHFQ